MAGTDSHPPVVLDRAGLGALLATLVERGYTVVGPTERDGAIVYDELEGVDDLPAGRTDVQEAGTYRLVDRDDASLFGYVVGPHSWRRYVSPPRRTIWRARAHDDGFEFDAAPAAPPRYAFVGVRACELAALAIEDLVFATEEADPYYTAAREEALLVAVHCTTPAATCFCTSTRTGPRAEADYDLALTEIVEDGRHEMVVEIGSARGAELVQAVEHRPASDADLAASHRITDAAVERLRTSERRLPGTGPRDLHGALLSQPEHPRWDDVAARCLGCANCTIVCPTCFCSTVEDVTDLAGTEAARVRSWDSCFTRAHSHLHGGSVRPDIRSRYRQWLTHKLDTWFDQYDVSGCVGCGRCITWCPAAIDLTEEARAIAPAAGEARS